MDKEARRLEIGREVDKAHIEHVQGAGPSWGIEKLIEYLVDLEERVEVLEQRQKE